MRLVETGMCFRVRFRSLFGSALGLVLLAGQPFVALAQELPKAPDTNAPDLVVTARKRPEILTDVPVSITALGAGRLEGQQVRRLNEIANLTPGLTFQPTAALTGSSNASSVFIRGIGQSDYSMATEPGVGIYVDDVYLSHSFGSLLDVVDLDRVEVLKGPQGTLFGRNSVGGAIRLVTKKPNFDSYDASAELTLGNYNRVDVKASANLPLSDTFAIRVSGMSASKDGYVRRPYQSTDSGNVDTKSLFVQARWQPVPELTADAAVNVVRDRSAAAASVLLRAASPPGATTNYLNTVVSPTLPASLGADRIFGPQLVPDGLVDDTNKPLKSRLNLVQPMLNVSWDFGPAQLRSISSFRHMSTDFGRDACHCQYFHVFDFYGHVTSEDYSQELQLSGQALHDRLNWIVGLYYFHEDGTDTSPANFATASIVTGGRVKTTSKAAYSQGTYEVLNGLKLTAGIRYSDERKTFIVDDRHQIIVAQAANSTSPVLPLATPTHIVPVGSYNNNKARADPYLNLSYKWTPSFMTYASYSQGYKGGGFQLRNAPGTRVVASFGPEYATTYEVGAKYGSANGRFSASVAGYHTNYRDLQLGVRQFIDGIASSITQNAGDARINGVEGEIAARPISGLNLNFGGSYIDAKYVDLSPTAVGITLDKKLPNVPKFQMNAAVSYQAHVGENGVLTPRVSWSHTSLVYNDSANSILVAGRRHDIFDASLGYEDRKHHWSITGYVKNIGNKLYYVSGFDSGSDYAEGVISQPREFGVRMKISLDRPRD
jgi:iron complex outermembrane recepter protein